MNIERSACSFSNFNLWTGISLGAGSKELVTQKVGTICCLIPPHYCWWGLEVLGKVHLWTELHESLTKMTIPLHQSGRRFPVSLVNFGHAISICAIAADFPTAVYIARQFQIKWYKLRPGVQNSKKFKRSMYLWYKELVQKPRKGFQNAATLDDEGNQPWGDGDVVRGDPKFNYILPCRGSVH